MKLILIRHAESLGNVAQEIQGQEDSPLSEKGRLQALQLGEYLRSISWNPSHIYASPLIRSQRTAELTVGSKALTIQVSPDLKEIHNGILQGLTWKVAQAKFPNLCAALLDTPEWIPIPEAEAPQDIFLRAQRFWDQILPAHNNTDQILIFTHGGFLQYLVAALLGCDRIWGFTIQPTALFEFDLDLEYFHTCDQNRFNPTFCKILRFNQMSPTHIPSF